MIYATFIVTTLVKERGSPEKTGSFSSSFFMAAALAALAIALTAFLRKPEKHL